MLCNFLLAIVWKGDLKKSLLAQVTPECIFAFRNFKKYVLRHPNSCSGFCGKSVSKGPSLKSPQ